MPRTKLPSLAAVALVVTACPHAPTGPELVVEPTSDHSVRLRWTPPAYGDYSGYSLEVRQLPGEFRTEGAALDTTTASYDFGTAPELSEFVFRVRALPDPEQSRASNEVAVRRPVAAAWMSCADPLVASDCFPHGGVILLNLTNRSLIADRLVLERVEGHGDEEGAPTQLATLPPSTTAWADGDVSGWDDCGWFRYELRAFAASEESPRVRMWTETAPPLPPSSLTATPIAGGFRISVENASRCEIYLKLIRRNVAANTEVNLGWLRASPYPGAVAWDDVGLAPGDYEYVAYTGGVRGGSVLARYGP